MRGQAGSSLWGYLTQLCPWGSCLLPSPPSRGLDGDVPAPRGLTCTSNSARPRPNSPPAQSRVGPAPNTHWVTLMGDVRGNDDKCQGDAGHTAGSWKVALRPATRLRLPGLRPSVGRGPARSLAAPGLPPSHCSAPLGVPPATACPLAIWGHRASACQGAVFLFVCDLHPAGRGKEGAPARLAATRAPPPHLPHL